MAASRSSPHYRRKAPKWSPPAQRAGRASMLGPSKPSTFISYPFLRMPHLDSQKSIYILLTQATLYVSLSLPLSFLTCPSLLHSEPGHLILQELAPSCLMEPLPDSCRQAISLPLVSTVTLQDKPLWNLSPEEPSPYS